MAIEELTIWVGMAFEYALDTGSHVVKKFALTLLMNNSTSMAERICILSSQREGLTAAGFLAI